MFWYKYRCPICRVQQYARLMSETYHCNFCRSQPYLVYEGKGKEVEKVTLNPRGWDVNIDELEGQVIYKEIGKMKKLNKERKMITNKQVQDNKFYVGSTSIFNRNAEGWGHPTLEEAIEHATALAQENESDQFVVQIVRVIRLQKAPVKVEEV